MEFNTWIRAIRPGLSAHLLPPLLLGQGIAFYLQQLFAPAISLAAVSQLHLGVARLQRKL